jgi:hypothetical protein
MGGRLKMGYFKENDEIKYTGVEPKNLVKLNEILIDLFVELGFKREVSDTEINFFFKKDLSICTYMKNEQFGITSPTKNQIMTSLKLQGNMIKSEIDLVIDILSIEKIVFSLSLNPKISICNLVIGFIRLLWYSGDKDKDRYVHDIQEFIKKMS